MVMLDCPALGGGVVALNCSGCNNFERCCEDGLPICISCDRQKTCSLKPTQMCSLYMEMPEYRRQNVIQ